MCEFRCHLEHGERINNVYYTQVSAMLRLWEFLHGENYDNNIVKSATKADGICYLVSTYLGSSNVHRIHLHICCTYTGCSTVYF